ncbi:MAG: response regulator [Terriglobia bacterium]|nr:response regulator [Terriglobia bacterium]
MSSKKSILLVDDEPNIRLVLGAILERAGFAVTAAEDGFAALRAIQRCRPDLVITDLRMPDMNGFELLSVLRARFPELPTVAISGEFLTIDVTQGPIADAFFQKGNYALSDFLDKISQLVEAPRNKDAECAVRSSTLWTPTGDAPVMLTCTNCLRTFPIDPCEGHMQSRATNCIFCGSALEIQLVAIGLAQPSTPPGAQSEAAD